MPPVVIAGAIGAAGAIGGAVIGSAASASDREAAAKAADNAAKIILETGAPPDLSRQIYMEQFRSAGILTPEMEQQINVQFEKIAPTNKKTMEAQQQALEGLRQASRGGMTAEERVAQTQIANRQARENEAAKNSIIQNLQQRGQAGGGAELAMRLQGSQANANAASEESDRVAASAQARALQSLGQLGNLSGQMRGQEFSENQAQSNIANEQNRFNVANQIAQQSRNVAAKNSAQVGNLTNAQSILNANTGMGNQERLRQADAERTYWQDKLGLNKAKAGAYNDQANTATKNADRTQGMWSGIGSAVGTAAGGIGQGIQNQNNFDRIFPQTPQETDYSQYAIKKATPTFGPRASGMTFSQGGIVPEYNQGGIVHATDPSTGLPIVGSSLNEYASGGRVRGPEIVPGDSPKNDVVHAMLEGGEYVVPKSDAPSMQLIHAILKGLKK